MRMSNRTVVTALAFVFMGSTLAQAQGPKKLLANLTTASQTRELVILSTAVDRANQTLTIDGQGFGFEPPQVWCETHSMTVLSATDNQLVVFLPGGVPDGTHLLTIVRGPSDKDRASFNMHVGTPGQGPAGPAGPKGDAGPAGERGDMGPAGPKGDAGSQGAAGAAGAKGDAGPAGPKGDTGAAGPAGATGATGPQGPAGVQGPAGPQGPQGAQGPVGPQGAAGLTGYQMVSSALFTQQLTGSQAVTTTLPCLGGRRVLGGGFDTIPGAANVQVVSSYASSFDTWKVTLRVNQDAASVVSIQYRVYAVCATATN